FFSSRRRHTRLQGDWSSDVCSSDLAVEYGEQKLSYGELDRRSNQLAHYLRKLGVGPEARVGICMERSVEMVVAVLGTLKAGGAYVPLAGEYPAARLQYLTEDAGVKVVLSQSHLAAEVE